MPNVTVCKSDKIHALERMISAKFLDRYKKLTERQSTLASRVYDEIHGKIGNQLRLVIGKDWQKWLTSKSRLHLKGCAMPELIVEHGKNGSKDLFTGLGEFNSRRKITALRNSVAWPASNYTDVLEIADATKAPRDRDWETSP